MKDRKKFSIQYTRFVLTSDYTIHRKTGFGSICGVKLLIPNPRSLEMVIYEFSPIEGTIFFV